MRRLLLAWVIVIAASSAAGSASAEPAPPWKPALDRIAARRDGFSQGLAAVLKDLRARVEQERPELLAKLSPVPPKPWPTGYAVLPRLDPDPPEQSDAAAPPSERRYSLIELAEWLERENLSAARIASDLAGKKRALDALVDDYLLREENFRRIDEHVKYHALWQREAWKNPELFQEPNRLLELYRVWRSTGPAAKGGAGEVRGKLETEMAKFKKLPWHHLEAAPDGFQVLKLRLLTDIQDEVFLSTVASGVIRVWNDAPAMRRVRLRLEILWERRDPASLFPAGVPARGTAIDIADHLTRFGPGFVMTTGAQSMHVLGGRGVMLGGSPTTCHVIAHEVSHLLGFADGYWRAYDGARGDPNGVVFHEVTPFPGNILSEPGTGKVSEAMARDLLQYGASAPGVR